MTADNFTPSGVAGQAAADDRWVGEAAAADGVARVYEVAPAGYAITALNAVLLALVMWPVVPGLWLGAWLATVALVTVARFALIRAWRRRDPAAPLAPWRRLMVAAAVAGGSLWGAAGGLFYPESSAVHQLFLGFLIGGMAAGVVPHLASLPAASRAFLLSCTLPFAARLFIDGEPMGEVMGTLVVVYTAMLWFSARHLHRSIYESLGLRFQGRRLTESLHHATAQLRAEIRVREQAERASAESERRARILVDAPFEGIVLHDHGTVLDINQTLLDMLGLNRSQALGRSVLDFVAPEARAAVVREMGHPTGLPFETLALRADGSSFIAEVRGRDLPSDGRTVRVVAIRDISERRAAEQQLRQLANYDPVTGLANRNLFGEHLDQAIARARRGNHFVALLCLDLDNFKGVNDTLGHAVGDEVLREAASRIKATIRGVDTAARLGGDEFALVLDSLAGADDALIVAQRLLAAVGRKYPIGNRELFVTASLGVALYPIDGSDTAALLRGAEVALYRAKDKGGGHYEFFAHEMNDEAVRRFELETGLHQALERSEFELHYQPKVALPGGEVIGVEALIRWRHPQQGMISPAAFIPIAEKSGLIVPIGEWVLESACAMMQRRREQGLAPLPVAVNLSLRQLKQKDIVSRIAAILERHRTPPQELEIEITEGSLADDIDYAIDVLRQLNALGVKLSIDDFGIGYSSLSYLKQFPVACLKVDRSFTRNVPDHSGDAAIVSAVAAMAASLGLEVLAEGVETRSQLGFLMGKGYQAIQGFLVSRPLPEGELGAWLAHWQDTVERDGVHPMFGERVGDPDGSPPRLNS